MSENARLRAALASLEARLAGVPPAPRAAAEGGGSPGDADYSLLESEAEDMVTRLEGMVETLLALSEHESSEARGRLEGDNALLREILANLCQAELARGPGAADAASPHLRGAAVAAGAVPRERAPAAGEGAEEPSLALSVAPLLGARWNGTGPDAFEQPAPDSVDAYSGYADAYPHYAPPRYAGLSGSDALQPARGSAKKPRPELQFLTASMDPAPPAQPQVPPPLPLP